MKLDANMDHSYLSEMLKFKFKIINDQLPNHSGMNTEFKYLHHQPIKPNSFIVSNKPNYGKSRTPSNFLSRRSNKVSSNIFF